MSTFERSILPGCRLQLEIFGTSHGPEIGMSLSGLPAGEAVDTEALQRFLDRRRPGAGPVSTARREGDRPLFRAGLKDGRSTGEAIRAVIENTDMRSRDYARLADLPRPGHADYPAWVKWGGKQDMRGGGPFSGRLTAPLCIAGGIALQLLQRRGITVGAHVLEAGSVKDEVFPLLPDAETLLAPGRKALPVCSDAAGSAMQAAVAAAAREGDSVGGIVECAAIGLPVGLGGPLFDGLEGRLSLALFGIPGVKGVEFGAGFAAAGLRGSEHNDPYYVEADGSIRTRSNHSGGILGGMSSGMPLTFRAAFKPTPSIARAQETVRLSSMQGETLEIQGRHDPCIVFRAVAAVEAAAALVLLDLILEQEEASWT